MSGIDFYLSPIDKSNHTLAKFVDRGGVDMFYDPARQVFGFMDVENERVVEAFKIHAADDWVGR